MRATVVGAGVLGVAGAPAGTGASTGAGVAPGVCEAPAGSGVAGVPDSTTPSVLAIGVWRMPALQQFG